MVEGSTGADLVFDLAAFLSGVEVGGAVAGAACATEAQVTITAADATYAVLARYQDQLRYLFIVSAVQLREGPVNGTGAAHIEVEKAEGAKCERCWNFSTRVGEDKNYPTVCERCSAVLKEIGRA